MGIKERRKALNMSQEELANKSGVTRVAISRYENNERKPSVFIAAKIARALGCTVDDLLVEE